MKLHINPEVMGRMFFYDIMLLYHRYEDYVNEENESQKQQQAEYEEKHSDMYSDIKSSQFNAAKAAGNFSMPNINYGNFNPSNFGF